MALWSGRFSQNMDAFVKEFNASIRFDQRLYHQDIKASIAHASMLAKQGIITHAECDQLVAGLRSIETDIKNGAIHFSFEDEDIHTAIEARLVERIGKLGEKLHIARSRNDQVQVDTRLYARSVTASIFCALGNLEQTILRQAKKYQSTPMIGYTHLRHAQPITIGFIYMAYFQMFRRDMERLQDSLSRLNLCPLGSCAIAGTARPIDRHSVAKELHFDAPTENAMDGVSDRDYIIEFLSVAATSMMHISRWAEELAWWSSPEFDFISIDDGFCTGSSSMPQKRNPDLAELLRAKSGRVYGALIQVLTVMKGMPLAYNKDFQEDKEPLFDAADTWLLSIQILDKMLRHIHYNQSKIKRCLKRSFSQIDNLDAYLASYNSYGGTAPAEVGRQIEEAHAWLTSYD